MQRRAIPLYAWAMRKTIILLSLMTGLLLASCSATGEARDVSSASSASSVSSASSLFKRFKPKPANSPVAQPVTDVPLSELKIPILVYHHVRKQEGWSKATWSWKMTVSPEIFEKQMQWIRDHGYTTITLDDFVAIMKGEKLSPPKPVVITFDDNNLNQYEVALPIMEKYNVKAVIYLVTNRLGNKSVIDAERAKDMAARGMDIQSHTVSHAGLSALSVAQMDHQLVDSRKALEELLGTPVRHVAYPLTMQNKTVRERTKAAGYTTGTIMDPRPATVKDDLFKLPRIMMTDDTDMKKLLP